MRGYGLKDGSKMGWKKGGRGRNRTSVCRKGNKYAENIVGNILGKNYKKRKIEIEKEGRDVEVEWDEDD